MNTNQQHASIDRIRAHLDTYIRERAAVKEVISTGDSNEMATSATATVASTIKKDYRGNQYELDQFLYRQSQIQYYASISKNKKPEVVRVHREFNSEAFERMRYLKKWGRLDEFAKQVVVKAYIAELAERELITAEQRQMVMEQALDLIRTKQLKKVTYDDTVGKVYEIAQLGLASLR